MAANSTAGSWPPVGSRIASLLEQRQELTDKLAESAYDIFLYLSRAAVYADLAYPDLAAGDAYRALLLTDEISDESFEYHDQTQEAMAPYATGEKSLPDVLRQGTPSNLASDVAALSLSPDSEETEDAKFEAHRRLASIAAIRCYQTLSLNLLLCGCLRSAHTFCERGLVADPNDKDLQQTKALIDTAARKRFRRADDATFVYNPTDLPDRGLVRREVYPWNTYEPDRFSAASLAFLNDELSRAAPKCEVRATELPILTEKDDEGSRTSVDGPIATCWQLGVFAKEPVAAGEAVLREYSLLTANNRLKESACDACGTELPSLADVGKKKKQDGSRRATYRAEDGDNDDEELVAAPVACPDCYDTVFCDDFCFEQAQEKYHPAVCETDVDSIAKDPEDARDADDALYVLLLARLLAMATHQERHPLEVDEIKYIWGDFVPPETNANAGFAQSVSPSSPEVVAVAAAGGIPPTAWSLPFSFEANIATPLHILEKMDLDVFADLAHYDLWVLNSCYSKFRGTASARKSRRDGRPDVAAVHPLWCLANHDCDPNVTWEWGGRMVLWAREKRVRLSADGNETRPGGIAAGQEILNHYCDVDLPVQLRREWASGSLGGACMCQRCRNEAAAEAKEAEQHIH
ncbi:mynd domain containing protein [Sporothrix schenckii 1099-18]|uniref:SET domain-containing protein n=2 Tax=Sporothrix schenckii TaxID=29908 RepID=U7Q180_SPOS1|nr:mynd domain containing protein [Sporothrix schenckii 1099-18]ERT00765.1 hypothetical protein HMPREF1624_01998 [Sporothrix schenckii ATCC 58251]KJR87848.1 mynd domain containing protein [Sporothrix schenckii 1099-18]